MALCDRCGCSTKNPENEYGDFICTECEQNAAEASWLRHCEDFHCGSSTQFVTLQQQQIAARRLK